ncbi:TIGR02300 family protein [Aquabacter sp. L1I39]|uniref:TIGR02300 family protein n=1 Tax=Aquabacter sp. L1I39 TaxID=2820278 RepID=UPI001ADBAF58|nr:TIGR02300 family protein [Aquabacter sp. L1I39]QTL03326.1 TIGR02300 family protein [Aquabacter sp. L1I39]
MAKPELGTKRVCPITGRKFYDLNKDPVVSPYTGESYPRSYFEPVARGATRGEARAAAVEEDSEDVADVEVISLEEADAESTTAKTPAAADDIDVDEDIVADGDDDTFLEEDEDDGDDVSDLIGEGLEDDEEA